MTSNDLAGTYLGQIVEAHRNTAARDRRSLTDLRASAVQARLPSGFAAALRTASSATLAPAVIAEIKRKSPSKGVLRADIEAATLASDYARGGASALSVLTDEAFFGGSIEDLTAARAATGLPTLRKDFTVCERDVYDARIMGADAVLLIVAALSAAELRDLSALTTDFGMDALVEVHDATELDRAMAVGATLIGVNQRDLKTFEVDYDRAPSLSESMPPEVVRVAESGVRDADDMAALAQAGYHAVLVGEALVTSDDPAAGLKALLEIDRLGAQSE